MALLATLRMSEVNGNEILPTPQWTFTCFMKNRHKSLKQGVKFVQA